MDRRHRAIALWFFFAVFVSAAIACNTLIGAELGELRLDDSGGADASTAVDSSGATVDGSSGADASTGDATVPTGDASPEKLAFGTIGGKVSGLKGKGLILKDNGADDLQATADGPFTFPAKVATGSQYNVTVSSQPSNPTQTCTVTKGSGTVDGANVTDVDVVCATAASTIGGNVLGLTGAGVVLTNNGADDLTVPANGPFEFITKLASGATFNVAIKTQPTEGGPCTVSGGSGTVGGTNVGGIVVNCTPGTFTVGGSVSGLNGSVVLANNTGTRLTLTSNGGFAFFEPLATGAAYVVTVLTQPTSPSQTCTIAGGSGTMGAANVTGVAVTCTTNTFAIGGNLSGLSGSIVLKNNGGDDLTVNASGPFTFATKVVSGNTYAVTIGTQPANQTCTLTGDTGTVSNAPITNVSVSCASISAATIVLGNKPTDPSNAANFTFTYTITGAAIGAQCKLDRPTIAGVFGPCDSNTSHAVSNLTDGTNTFTVQVQNAGGAVSSAVYSWTVDRTPPTIAYTNTPANPTFAKSATFNYVITGSVGIAECKLDTPGGPGTFTSCGSNTSRSVLTPVAGNYTAAIRATDGLNTMEVAYSWVVLNSVLQAQWTLNGSINSGAPFPVTTVATKITASNLNNVGTGPVNFANAFVGALWPPGPLDPNKYFEFSVGNLSSDDIYWDTLSFSLYNNFNGATAWAVRSSVDGFSQNLGSGAFAGGIAGGGIPITVNLWPLGPIDTNVTFRFYSFNNSGLPTESPFQRGFRGSAGGGIDLKIFGVRN